jgi:hypothetical protein
VIANRCRKIFAHKSFVSKNSFATTPVPVLIRGIVVEVASEPTTFVTVVRVTTETVGEDLLCDN